MISQVKEPHRGQEHPKFSTLEVELSRCILGTAPAQIPDLFLISCDFEHVI